MTSTKTQGADYRPIKNDTLWEMPELHFISFNLRIILVRCGSSFKRPSFCEKVDFEHERKALVRRKVDSERSKY